MLIPAYEKVKGSLQKQVQGTCGIYSFYTGVQILRSLNPRNPAVPAPKKRETRSTDATGSSLRCYAKRQLQSGQGEVLSNNEMSQLVAAHGYAPLSCGGSGDTDKKEFLAMCMLKGYPVLIAYLADEFGGSVRYTTADSPDPGAHWSLIIGVGASDAKVVEPNAPRVLCTWPMDDLLLANANADAKKFPRYWAKTVYTGAEVRRQLKPKTAKGPKMDLGRGISPLGKSLDKVTLDPRKGEVGTYDLGGTSGTRHDDQKLNHVLVAMIPPHEPAK